MHYQPGSRLIQYAMGPFPAALFTPPNAATTPGSAPPPINKELLANPGVIYSSFVLGGRPSEMQEAAFKFLLKAGVSSVVVGNQPLGDMPLTINNKEKLQVR